MSVDAYLSQDKHRVGLFHHNLGPGQEAGFWILAAEWEGLLFDVGSYFLETRKLPVAPPGTSPEPVTNGQHN
jgi:hypothetical protein